MFHRQRLFGKTLPVVRLLLLIVCIYFLGLSISLAQDESTPRPTFSVQPHGQRYFYRLDDPAGFDFSIKANESNQNVNSAVKIVLSRDGGELLLEREWRVAESPLLTLGAKLSEPGFLRAEIFSLAENPERLAVSTVGYTPQNIFSATKTPEDFRDFWQDARQQLAHVPPDYQLEELPQFSDKNQSTFMISFLGLNSQRYFGYLSVPKSAGRHPALMRIPSWGVGRPKNADWVIEWGRRGFVSLYLDIHGLRPGEPVASPERFDDYEIRGVPDRRQFYYYNVLLGLDRALDFLRHHESVDLKRLGLTAASQGAGLALMLAGLNADVKTIVAHVPAFGDHAGIAMGRQPGWPGVCHKKWNEFSELEKQACLDFSAYYDTVNFAPLVKGSALVGMAWNDTVCPASSVMSVYNALNGEKRLIQDFTATHAGIEGFDEIAKEWLLKKLK